METTNAGWLAEAAELIERTIVDNPFIPQTPTTKQGVFLAHPAREIMYGGAAGGAKSSALLMAALQYVDVPEYSALLLRRSYSDLSLPGAIMDRAKEWLIGTGARWQDRDKRWTFPSGATLTFGYLENSNDRYRYQGAEFTFIGFDELTQFQEADYRYLFSRLRRLATGDVPIRMRSASNPGGIGHEWVRQRFLVEGRSAGRWFIPAKLNDNPYLDATEYRMSLTELDPVTRAQLLNGDWTARNDGGYFRREWMPIVDAAPAQATRVRWWDFAATEVNAKKSNDPDYTCGVLLAKANDGLWYVEDVRRARATPASVEALVRQTAELDGRAVAVYVEQEPGSSGKQVADRYIKLLAGFNIRAVRSTGPKEERAKPFSAQCEAGNVRLVRGAWLGAFLDEAEAFPMGAHDDQVDAASAAFGQLNIGRPHSGAVAGTRTQPATMPTMIGGRFGA